MRLEFLTYLQVFEDNTPSNTPQACSLGAIVLDPTGNAQGDYNVVSLATGACLSHHQCTALPMTDMTMQEFMCCDYRIPPFRSMVLGLSGIPIAPLMTLNITRLCPPNVPTDVPLCKDLDPVDTEELDNLVADAAAHNILHDPVVVSPTLAQGASPWIFDKEQQAAFMEHEDEAFGENGNHAELNHDDDDENNYKHN